MPCGHAGDGQPALSAAGFRGNHMYYRAVSGARQPGIKEDDFVNLIIHAAKNRRGDLKVSSFFTIKTAVFIISRFYWRFENRPQSQSRWQRRQAVPECQTPLSRAHNRRLLPHYSTGNFHPGIIVR